MTSPDDRPAPALGCMRLSTAPDRDDERSISVLHAALDAGVRLLDTADVYCRDETEIGHNERLIARALATWSGDRSQIRVATKGGLTRPDGAWIPDGRARHLAAACEASRRALGVERISLYQLHALDPRVPLATSMRALRRLQDEGAIAEVGLSNVNVGQIEEAQRITKIAAVQVELSLWHDDNLLNGVAEHCRDRGIPLLAYRPLGGPERRRKLLSDPVLAAIAARHQATPFEIALVWIYDLSPLFLPLPGATRVETVRSLVRAREIVLSEEDRAQLDGRFPSGRLLRRVTLPSHRPSPAGDGEVVLVMGLPAAGKSTLARDLVRQGYDRLNRDEAGGTVADLLPELDQLVAKGRRRIILDNTYVSRKSRRPVIERARSLGLAVRCLWLDTPLEHAQVNAAWRMVSRYGRLLEPTEIAAAAKADPGAFAPSAQFRMKRALEPPTLDEGFDQVEVAQFARQPDASLTNRALLFWCEGVLVRSRSGSRAPTSPDDLELLPNRADALRRYADEGCRLVGLSWRPEIAEGTLTRAQVDATHKRIEDLLGVTADVLYCPHAAGPPVCWCRKPLPGLGVVAIQRHRLDVSQCLFVGASSNDASFARRLGLPFRDAGAFFEVASA